MIFWPPLPIIEPATCNIQSFFSIRTVLLIRYQSEESLEKIYFELPSLIFDTDRSCDIVILQYRARTISDIANSHKYRLHYRSCTGTFLRDQFFHGIWRQIKSSMLTQVLGLDIQPRGMEQTHAPISFVLHDFCGNGRESNHGEGRSFLDRLNARRWPRSSD